MAAQDEGAPLLAGQASAPAPASAPGSSPRAPLARQKSSTKFAPGIHETPGSLHQTTTAICLHRQLLAAKIIQDPDCEGGDAEDGLVGDALDKLNDGKPWDRAEDLPDHFILRFRWRLFFALVSLSIVIIKVAAISAFLAGYIVPGCSEVDSCKSGTFCDLYVLRPAASNASTASGGDDETVSGLCVECPLGWPKTYADDGWLLPAARFGLAPGGQKRRLNRTRSDWNLTWPVAAPSGSSPGSAPGRHQCEAYHLAKNRDPNFSRSGYAAQLCSAATATSNRSRWMGDDSQGDCVHRIQWMITVCEACKGEAPDGRLLFYMSNHDVVSTRILSMRSFDLMMLAAAFLIVTLSAAGSLRSAAVVEMTRRSALAGEPAGTCCSRSPIPNGWHVVLLLVLFCRLALFLPMAVMAVPLSVLFRGSTAIDIAMDTVAVLFLLEFDELVFSHGMSQDIRAYVSKYCTSCERCAAIFHLVLSCSLSLLLHVHGLVLVLLVLVCCFSTYCAERLTHFFLDPCFASVAITRPAPSGIVHLHA